MAPRLLLRIGTEKTGTTAWQAWLASRQVLSIGIDWPCLRAWGHQPQVAHQLFRPGSGG